MGAPLREFQQHPWILCDGGHVGRFRKRVPRGRAVTEFNCEYSELLPIALECSSAEMESEDFCSSDCAIQLLPMIQQCASRGPFEEAIQMLVGRPVGKLVSECVVQLPGALPDSGSRFISQH